MAASGFAIAALPVAAESAERARPARTVPVRLLAVNDLHGNLEPPTGSSGRITDENGVVVEGAGGIARIATTIKELRTENTTVVAAGDLIGASPLISAAYHDEPTLEILGRLGLRAAAAGNHEFDEGYAELRRITDGGCHPKDGCSPRGAWPGTAFDYLAANVLKKNGGHALPPVFIRKVNGVRIGFIGLVTATTPTIVTAEGIKGLTFTEEVAAANRASGWLTRQGVKAQVILMHEGDQVAQGQSPDACPIVAGAGSRIAGAAAPEIDLVISGHSHQAYVCETTDPAGGRRLFTQGSSFGRVLTQIDFAVDRRSGDVVRSTVTADNRVIRPTITPDPETAAAVAYWKEQVGPVADRPIGRITADLSNVVDTTSPANANPETPLGSVIADSQLASVREATGARIALMNPGGIRTVLRYAQSGGEGDGAVTYGEAFAVQPFGNVVQVRTYTGDQLRRLLEQQVWSVAGNGTVTHRVLQVSSSLTYTFDTTKPVGERVSDIRIDGREVTPEESIKIAANSFLMGGGDGFSVFAEPTDLFSGPDDLAAFAAYLTANSPVAPPATGRITFVK